jgi:O-antigen/teichoic acid export membrane protein
MSLAGIARDAIRAVRLASPRLLLVTASSLAGSMVLSAVFGAAFWWLAARLYPAHAVGVAVASLSAMSLVGSLSLVGAGTLLVRELHHSSGRRLLLAGTASISAGALAALVGIVFAVGAPRLNPELSSLAASPLTVLAFTAGVVLTAVAAVIDDILLGLLRAQLRLYRNAVFNVAKIGALLAMGVVLGGDRPLEIYGSWVAGILLSLLVLLPAMRGHWSGRLFSWAVMREHGPGALAHQGLNTALELPALGIPVAVALLVSPQTTAQFYIAFMLASVSFYVPLALAQTLYAVGSRHLSEVWQHARVTIGGSLAAGIAAVVAMFFLAEPILGLFGPQYAAASGIAPLLAAVSVPLVAKDHFQVIFRVYRRETFALVICGLGAALEIAAAVVGVKAGGLPGLAIGWLAAVILEAMVMGPALLAIARSHRPEEPAA